MSAILIADSGATKCEWRLVEKGKKKTILTQGISPYFLNGIQIEALLNKELLQAVQATEDELPTFLIGKNLSL